VDSLSRKEAGPRCRKRSLGSDSLSLSMAQRRVIARAAPPNWHRQAVAETAGVVRACRGDETTPRSRDESVCFSLEKRKSPSLHSNLVRNTIVWAIVGGVPNAVVRETVEWAQPERTRVSPGRGPLGLRFEPIRRRLSYTIYRSLSSQPAFGPAYAWPWTFTCPPNKSLRPSYVSSWPFSRLSIPITAGPLLRPV